MQTKLEFRIEQQTIRIEQQTITTMNIAILGGGNLGAAIAQGIVKAKVAKASQVFITRRHPAKLEELSVQGFKVTTDNVEAVKNSSIIMLCVQPKQLGELLLEINSVLDKRKHLLVSTITGVAIEEIAAKSPKEIQIIRAMPNTAVAIGVSMTCLCTTNASTKQMSSIQNIFNALGETLIIEERLMKAATVLAASGIAFFMRYLRAATQGGIQLGFDSEEAQLIARQTAKGAAMLLQQHHSHPEVEIDKVTTPEGCTIAGLNEMEHQGLSSALIKGIVASFEKISRIRS
jgi:pyrroline-5-carboxylate reductase